MDSAFEYTLSHALENQVDYPYRAIDQPCHANKTLGVVNTVGFVDVPENDPLQLQAAVAQGPVSVAIQAGSTYFRSYSHGILSSPSCGTNLDHGVLVIGYGTDENGTDYWLLKNSWGVTWGDFGLFKILRTSEQGPGICGLQLKASYPLV